MRQVRSTHPAARLAVLAEYDSPEVRAQAAAMGGTFLGTRPEDIRARARDLLAGRRQPTPTPPPVAAVAVDLDRGLTVRQSARSLGLAEATVKGYTRTLFAKLGIHSRAEAVHRARMLGLLDSAGVGAHPARGGIAHR